MNPSQTPDSEATPPIEGTFGHQSQFHSGSVSGTRSVLGSLPFVRIAAQPGIAGDPEAPFRVGEAQGVLLQELVRKVWEFYRTVRFTKFTNAQLREHGEHFERVIEGFDSAYAAEIRGVAVGAGLEPWQGFALNARTELINRALQMQGVPQPGECTSVSFGDGAALIGQTWDWATDMAPLMAVVEITRPDGHTVLFIGEPGIIGKMGINSKGVGVCLNILTGEGRSDGVPIHILLRSALDTDSTAAAISRFQNTPHRATMSNILIADRSGAHALVEFYGNELAVRESAGDLCHTNHFLHLTGTPLGTDCAAESTKARYRRASELLGSTPGRSLEDLRTILGDTQDPTYPISAPPKYYEQYGMTVETIITLIADLKNRTIHFSHSKDRHASFTAYTLGESSGSGGEVVTQ